MDYGVVLRNCGDATSLLPLITRSLLLSTSRLYHVATIHLSFPNAYASDEIVKMDNIPGAYF